MENNFDVIVIGGGPSGAATATFLAREGHQVLVLEKEKFPRPHVGESLLPYSYSIFKELGVYDQMCAQFIRKPGVRFINHKNTASSTYCFANIITGPEKLSFHVIRSEFDDLLFRNAEKNGVTIKEGIKVKNVILPKDDAQIELQAVDEHGETLQYTAQFLVDATGQQAFLAGKLGIKEKYEGFNRTSFTNHWKDVSQRDELKEGLLEIVYLPKEKQGWMSIIPLAENRVSIGLVLSNDYVRKRKKALLELGYSNWQEALYLSELRETVTTHVILEKAQTLQDIMVVGDYSYKVEKKFGTNYAMVGDASGFIDPIFSTGIFIGLNSAKLVAKAINKILDKEQHLHGLQMLERAYQQIAGVHRLVHSFVQRFYHPDHIQLTHMAPSEEGGTEDFKKRKIAFSLLHYLMAGDTFNEYEKYHEMLTYLDNPKQLARFKHLVMDQSSHKVDLCSEIIES